MDELLVNLKKGITKKLEKFAFLFVGNCDFDMNLCEQLLEIILNLTSLKCLNLFLKK